MFQNKNPKILSELWGVLKEKEKIQKTLSELCFKRKKEKIRKTLSELWGVGLGQIS